MTYNMYWYGMLTTGNVEQVGKLLRELLVGKFHTVIAAHPVAYEKGDAHLSMDVHTSQKLYENEAQNGVKAEANDDRAHVTIHNSYGLWMLDSSLTDERPSDSSGRNPYIVFKGNQVTITHRAPAGNLLVWTFAVEDHAE
jgi:hypothetical protein